MWVATISAATNCVRHCVRFLFNGLFVPGNSFAEAMARDPNEHECTNVSEYKIITGLYNLVYVSESSIFFFLNSDSLVRKHFPEKLFLPPSYDPIESIIVMTVSGILWLETGFQTANKTYYRLPFFDWLKEGCRKEMHTNIGNRHPGQVNGPRWWCYLISWHFPLPRWTDGRRESSGLVPADDLNFMRAITPRGC